MVKYEDPIPTQASKVSVSAFAEGVAKSLEYQFGEPIELIVSKVGGAISYVNPIGESKPESIRVEPAKSFTIYLPSMTSASRDRFTIAHELGHLFLHFPLVQKQFPKHGMRAYRWADDSNQALQRCEWEANWFSAAFVMPEAPFREAFASGGITAVSVLFGVSEKAAEVRAKSLGML